MDDQWASVASPALPILPLLVTSPFFLHNNLHESTVFGYTSKIVPQNKHFTSRIASDHKHDVLLLTARLWLLTGNLFLCTERQKQTPYPAPVKWQRALSRPTSSWTRRAENGALTRIMTRWAPVVPSKPTWCSPGWGNIGLHGVSTSSPTVSIFSLFLLQMLSQTVS